MTIFETAAHIVYAAAAISTHSPHVLQRRHGEKAEGEPLSKNMKLRYGEGEITILESWSTSVLERVGVGMAVTHEPANHEMVDWSTRARGIS